VVSLPRGVRFGIDVGKVRIGVAQSDPDGLLAMPVETVQRQEDGSIAALCARIAESEPVCIYVGLPLSLNGSHTASTEDALALAREINDATGVQVQLIDERLSTVSAQAALHASGKTTKSSRGVVDQVAAVMILQQALDTERAQSQAAGISLDGFSSGPGSVR
jgi:putative Holliday junction resolvase